MSSRNTKNYRKETPPSTEDNFLQFGKLPPQAPELESAVLGAILLEKGALDEVAGIIQPESFYMDANQHVYRAIQTLASKSLAIDLLTVVEELRRTEKLEQIGGGHYITQLTSSVVSSANIKQHARIVQEKYLLRSQISVYSKGIHDCYEPSADGFEILDTVSGQITSLAMQGVKGQARRVGDIAIDRMVRLEGLRSREDGITGVPSGFEDIDRITGGWQDTNLIIIAARPSVGKTAFALQCARNAASHHRKPTPTALFSLEMSEGQLADRSLSCESGIPLEYITKAKVDDKLMQQLYETGVQPLSEYPLYIDDTPALNMVELRAKCRKLKNEQNIGLIVIDYLQLMSGLKDERRQYSREQEVSNISRSLKALAKELKVPIIALSQLNREAEKSEPTLGTLRESGAIEQDADDVLFLYREDYQKMENEIDPMLKGLSYVKIAKHRNGPLEKIPMHVDLSIQRWMIPSEWRTYQGNVGMPQPGNWKRVANTNDGARLYIMGNSDPF